MREKVLYGARILLASLLMSMNLVSLSAEASDRTIGQFVHTSWTEKDGAPPVFCLAQTPDGFLWLGTKQGLFRFDGISFERYEPPSGPAFPALSVRSLLALPNGDLWIGFNSNGVSRLRGGRNTNYGDSDGPQPGRVANFVQDREGTIWATSAGGLARFKDDHWERIGKNWGFPGGAASAAYVDRHGALWVAVDRTLISLPPGAKTFQPTGIAIGMASQITESPDGTLWMAETTLSVHPLQSFKPEIRVGSMSILFDDDGSLWITSLGDGMRRVPDLGRLNGESSGQLSSAIESFTSKDGLSSDLQTSILKDREGNIWVGTVKGLDRFTRGALVPIVLPPKFTLKTLVPGNQGDIWICGWSDVLGHIEGTKLTSVEESAEISQGFRDAHGAVWFLRSFRKQDGPPYYDVSRLENGRIVSVARTLDLLNNFGEGALFATDRTDTIWFGWFRAAAHKLFYRATNSAWAPFELPPAIAGKTGTVAFTDPSGRVWFGFTDDTILLIDGTNARMFSAKDGIKIATVKAIAGLGPLIWIGGDNGLELWQDGRFQSVLPTDGDAFHNIGGIQQDSVGDLFLSEKRGLVFIPASEISKTLKDRSARVRYGVFDVRDGLTGAVVQATDGRIWVSTTNGVAWIDPARVPTNASPPPTAIRSITANGTRYTSPEALRLPPRTRDLTVDYTALSLTTPERAVFRYKLEGSDTQWREAGTRRQAFYTNLSPGPYRFRVTASNNDGIWNEAGASWAFTITPTFYETVWFKTLMALVAIGLMWLLYRLRLLQITSQADLIYAERLEERTRIARELHDTLLQSFHGLMFRYQAARNMLPQRPEEAMHALDQALEGTEKAVAEGRDAIHNLRASTEVTNELAQAVTALGSEMSHGIPAQSARYHVVVEGSPHHLHPMLRDEVYAIAREAVRNAFRHAQAHDIEVEITYNASSFRLRVRDDGKGIDPAILAEGRTGHYGVPGMRERAKRIGGELDVWAETGAGTEVELSVPGSIAYGTSASRTVLGLFGKKAAKE